MKIEINLKKGVEYTLSNSVMIDLVEKEINPLWDPDNDMLHFCIELSEEEYNSSNGLVEEIELFGARGGEDKELLISLRDVSLVPGNNIFQILLTGCIIQNDPGTDTKKLLTEIERTAKLENIPEKDEYVSKYLETLDGNPLGAFNKYGERIYQKHTEKLIESITLQTTGLVIGPRETSIPIKGKYTYCLKYIENGEIIKVEDIETGELEETNYEFNFISAPGGVKFEQGRLYIPENPSSDNGRSIRFSIKLGELEKLGYIYQDRAELTYSVSYSTNLTKNNVPIFVLSGTGGTGEIVIDNLNADVEALQYLFPSYSYINYDTIIESDKKVKITLLSTEHNEETSYRPAEPSLYEVKTMGGITICSFYVVQAVKSTSHDISIVDGNQATVNEIIAGNSVEFAITSFINYPNPDNPNKKRYWKCNIYNSRGGVSTLTKAGNKVEEGVVWPADPASGQPIYTYLYKINTHSPYVEEDTVIGSVTFISPDTEESTLNMGWESVALSDTKTVNLVAKAGTKIINVPEKLEFQGLGVYNLIINTNRTLTIQLPSSQQNNNLIVPKFATFEDGSVVKTIIPSTIDGQAATITIPIRFFGPSPKTGIISSDSGDFEKILVFEGSEVNFSKMWGDIKVISHAVSSNISITQYSNLLRDDQSLFILNNEGGDWSLHIHSAMKILESSYDIELDWDNLDNGIPDQIIRRTTGQTTTSQGAIKIFELNPAYYRSEEKILTTPFIVIQMGEAPSFILTEGGGEADANSFINITEKNYENNHTIYWNNEVSGAKQIRLEFFCKYKNIDYTFIPTTDFSGRYSSLSISSSQSAIDTESGRKRYYTATFTSDPLRMNDDQTGEYLQIGVLTVTCIQKGSYNWVDKQGTVQVRTVELGRKTLTLNFFGGTPKPVIIGDNKIHANETNFYRIENLEEGFTITSITRRLTKDSGGGGTFSETDYCGMRIETRALPSGNSFEVRAYDPIYPVDIENFSGYDWRFFFITRVESNGRTIHGSTNLTQALDDEELEITLGKTNSDEEIIITYPIVKLGYRGHYEINEELYGPNYFSSGFDEIIRPNYIDNWKKVYTDTIDWNNTYLDIEYNFYLYDSEYYEETKEVDVIEYRSQHHYLSFPQNEDARDKQIEDSIVNNDVFLPISITQKKFNYTFTPINDVYTFSAAGGYANVLNAVTSLTYGDFRIVDGDNNDVTNNFYILKDNGHLLINYSAGKNTGTFKTETYAIIIRGESGQPRTFTIKQEGLRISFFGPNTDPEEGVLENKPLELPAEGDNGVNHKFTWLITKYKNSGQTLPNKNKLRLIDYTWICKDPSNPETTYDPNDVFESWGTYLTTEVGSSDPYIYNAYTTNASFSSNRISISVLVEVEIEDEENFSDELTMYLLKEGVSQ